MAGERRGGEWTVPCAGWRTLLSGGGEKALSRAQTPHARTIASTSGSPSSGFTFSNCKISSWTLTALRETDAAARTERRVGGCAPRTTLAIGVMGGVGDARFGVVLGDEELGEVVQGSDRVRVRRSQKARPNEVRL